MSQAPGRVPKVATNCKSTACGRPSLLLLLVAGCCLGCHPYPCHSLILPTATHPTQPVAISATRLLARKHRSRVAEIPRIKPKVAAFSNSDSRTSKHLQADEEDQDDVDEPETLRGHEGGDDDEDGWSEDADDDFDMSQDDRFKQFEKVLNGVVRVYCTHSMPNFGQPWQKREQYGSTSTGFMIGDRLIVTNAHSVEYASLIQVKKRLSEKKCVARVVAIGHECDLALLSVQDESFWIDSRPLDFGEMPDLQDSVCVVGYPVGGNSVSITAGVVSRIEMQTYAQASAELLAIQIDAAINPGNSGGPCVDDRYRIIGVAFQSLSEEDTENIGYVVPVSVLKHFLEDVRRNGKYSGVCDLGIRWQAMESEPMKKSFEMSEDMSGILVRSVEPLAPSSRALLPGDVITAIDGISIGDDGFIMLDDAGLERIQVACYFTQKFQDETVNLQVLRNGKLISVDTSLWVPQYLVPRFGFDMGLPYAQPSTYSFGREVTQKSSSKQTRSKNSRKSSTVQTASAVHGSLPYSPSCVPGYIVIGGLVFLRLLHPFLCDYMETEDVVESIGGDVNNDELRHASSLLSLVTQTKRTPDEDAVVLAQVLAHECTLGYEDVQDRHLIAFNGHRITSLRHLYNLVQSCTEPFMRFSFSCDSMIVLDTQQARQATQEICREHCIPRAVSSDLLA